MKNIQSFMGTAYHDGITVEEIDSFLEGKKYADLSTGNYVAKDKYENLQLKLNESNENLKEYAVIKPKYEEFLEKERNAVLTKEAKNAGILPEFIEFAISKIGKQEDMASAFKQFAKENKQFTTKQVVVKTNSNPSLMDKEGDSIYELMNNQIRQAAGYGSEE